jgi:hypothetical protein
VSITAIAAPDPDPDEFDALTDLIRNFDQMPADLLTDCWFCDGTGTHTSKDLIVTACAMCGGLGKLPGHILDGI